MRNESCGDNPFEVIPDPETEAQQIREIAQLTIALLEKRYGQSGRVLRGVHPKSHGCVWAQFQVLPDIEEQFQVGLFQPGSCHEAIVRYSNADTLVRHDLKDGENGSRGMAVKILGVKGDLLFEDQCESAQDFLMINTPQFAFANVVDYLKLQQILLKFDDSPLPFFAPLQSPPPTEPELLSEFLRVKRSFDVVQLIKQTPVANPLQVSYFGAAPFLFGPDRVMRVSVVPVGTQPEQLVPENADENYLGQALQRSMLCTQDIVYDFNIQVRHAGEEDLFIEDATQFWPESSNPATTVARLTIPAPQTILPDCEERFFTPWHSLADHQPLGGINRLRKAVYFASAKRRGAIADYAPNSY